MFHTQVMFSCLIMIFRDVYSVVFLGVRMIKSLMYVCFLSHCQSMNLLFVYLSCSLTSYSPLLEMKAVVRGALYGSPFLPTKKKSRKKEKLRPLHTLDVTNKQHIYVKCLADYVTSKQFALATMNMYEYVITSSYKQTNGSRQR